MQSELDQQHMYSQTYLRASFSEDATLQSDCKSCLSFLESLIAGQLTGVTGTAPGVQHCKGSVRTPEGCKDLHKVEGGW